MYEKGQVRALTLDQFWGDCGWAMVLGNFQCQGVLHNLIIVEQGPTVLAVGASGVCLDIFSLHFSFLPSL